jgi:hypothetical protein
MGTWISTSDVQQKVGPILAFRDADTDAGMQTGFIHKEGEHYSDLLGASRSAHTKHEIRFVRHKLKVFDLGRHDTKLCRTTQSYVVQHKTCVSCM